MQLCNPLNFHNKKAQKNDKKNKKTIEVAFNSC